MINFLRKDRLKMFSENKMGKYISYGIGEIVLVVIGILLALTINNWNTNKKERIVEQNYLLEILTNLESDQSQLNNVIEKQTESYNLINVCINSITAKNYNQKHLASKFATTVRNNHTFFPFDGAYLSLISSGQMNLIQNKALSSTITNLYEHSYQRLLYNGEVIDQRVDNLIFDSQSYFIHESGNFIDSTVIDSKMLAQLNYLARGKRVYLERSNSALISLNSTLSQIRSELNK